VEDDIRAQLHGQRLAISTPGPLRRKLRNVVKLGINIDELIANGCKNYAANKGCALRGIKPIRIFLQPNPQGLCARGAPACNGKSEYKRDQSVRYAHHSFPNPQRLKSIIANWRGI
jgi:hypothetical protein